MKENKIRLKRAAFPEEVGVSSAEIAEMITDFAVSDIEVHSIMILRNGKVAFESWADPYSPDIPHAMYSVSKSFTSTAIGFAINEGLITLESKLIDFFPEYRPDNEDKNLELLNVHHLLSMQSGKSVSVFSDKSKNHWIKDFFDAPWKFTPGNGHWEYISENQYMLCALLTRVTGMSVIEYLTPRLFEPLGIDVPFWEHDIDGIEAGGWGMFLKTEDLAKFTLCYLDGGMFNGKQIIPTEWVQLALKNQADNSPYNIEPDSQAGYGYCFWRNAGVNGFRADGMFSQFGIIAKDYNAAFIITAGEISEPKTRECIWRHFPKCLIEPCDTTSDTSPSLAPLDEDLPALDRSTLEAWLSGKILTFQKNLILSTVGFPVSMLPLPVVYMSADKAGDITDVSFEFDSDTCKMTWSEGDEQNTIVCGMDGNPRKSPITLAGINFTAYATAAWTSQNELSIYMRPLEAVAQRRIVFVFNNNKVEFHPSSKPDMKHLTDVLKTDYLFGLFPTVLLQKIGNIAFDQLPSIVDATYYGKFKESIEVAE